MVFTRRAPDHATRTSGASLTPSITTDATSHVDKQADVNAADAFTTDGGPKLPVPGTGKATAPSTAPATRKGIVGFPAGLSAADRTTMDGVLASKEHGPQLKALMADAKFRAMPDAERTEVFAAMARCVRDGADTGQMLRNATMANGFAGHAAAPKRAQLVMLGARMPQQCMDSFASLAQSPLADQKDAGGKTVLQHLNTMASQYLTPPGVIDRAELLSQTMRDVLDPTLIRQGARNTCGATSASIVLARTQPAEYVRLITELTDGVAGARLPNGDTIETEPGVFTDDSGRTLTGRLLQPALMEYANGTARYDNATEKHTRALPKNIPGLTQPEMERLGNAMFPGKGPFDVNGADMGIIEIARSITRGNTPNYPSTRRALERGEKPMFALLDVDLKLGQKNTHRPATGFHWVSVTEVKDGRVYFDDPNRITNDDLRAGRRHRPGDYRVEADGRASMAVDDFCRSMWSMVAPEP